MRAILMSLALMAVYGAGCIGTSDDAADEAVEGAALDAVLPEPVTVDWAGHVLLSPLGAFAHNPDTEELVRPVQSEGFVFEITEAPQRMEVSLDWSPPPVGEILIMVSSPRDAENPGLEFFTDMSSEAHQCLQVPPELLEQGRWQVMVHSSGVVAQDYTFHVTTWGGAGAIVPGAHSAAEAAETTAEDILPCEGEMHEHA